MRPRRPRTQIQRTAQERTRRLFQQLAADIVEMRLDAGLSRRAVAAAAGIATSTLGDLEAARGEAGVEVITRVATALGASVGLRLNAESGPLVRDHLQAAMIQALIRALDGRWRRQLEVPVYRPVRGVIDAVLEDRLGGMVVTVEAQPELRRIEQQLRWGALKSDALAAHRRDAGHPTRSRGCSSFGRRNARVG